MRLSIEKTTQLVVSLFVVGMLLHHMYVRHEQSVMAQSLMLNERGKGCDVSAPSVDSVTFGATAIPASRRMSHTALCALEATVAHKQDAMAIDAAHMLCKGFVDLLTEWGSVDRYPFCGRHELAFKSYPRPVGGSPVTTTTSAGGG